MKLCMGCMNQVADHEIVCPHCGFNETTLRQESYYLDPGTIVGGKYIVGRVMSYGGHTVSYLGYDAEKNQKVIIKEYLPSDFSTRSDGEKEVTIYSGDAETQFMQGLTNYLNESSRIQQLGHVDGIADIYDCLAENETGYVISEYVEGQSLKAIMDSGKKYSVSATVSVIKKILNGLRQVHPLDVIHCDIAPETVMITDNGEIKLTDFGATRYVTTANSKSLAIILKQGYAPEEQYRSKGVRGPWTDVYAVAAVMYRMITGIVPQESVERALMDELKEPSKMGVQIPTHIENALMNALNVYQEERTPSAEVFLKELNNKETKRRKVKRAKKSVAKVPIWAKTLVAGLALVVVVGGAIIVRSLSQNTTAETKTCAVPDFTGETIEEAQKKVEAWKESDIDITIAVGELRYSPDQENDGKIFYQDVASGTELLDPEKVEALEKEDLVVGDDGKITGTIKCDVYTNETITYGELADKNAYLISQYLKEDITGKLFEKDRHPKKEEEYWTLKSITVKGKEITPKALASEDKKDTTIKVKDIDKISYYGSAFFKLNPLPDFEEDYGTLKKLQAHKFKRYEYISETETKKKDKKVLPSSMIDQNWFSFENAEGTIVGQSIPAGKSYDSSEDGTLEIFVIKEQLGIVTPKGKNSAPDVKNWIKKEAKLKSEQIKIECDGEIDPSYQVISYSIRENGNTVKNFKKGNPNIVITLTVKEKPPVVVEPSKPSSGGSSSGGTGGSNPNHNKNNRKNKKNNKDKDDLGEF